MLKNYLLKLDKEEKRDKEFSVVFVIFYFSKSRIKGEIEKDIRYQFVQKYMFVCLVFLMS